MDELFMLLDNGNISIVNALLEPSEEELEEFFRGVAA
jgi:hypothetical protein